MEVNNTGNSLFVKADEGKVLVFNGNTFGCAYMSTDADVSAIIEITESEFVDDSVALEELTSLITE